MCVFLLSLLIRQCLRSILSISLINQCWWNNFMALFAYSSRSSTEQSGWKIIEHVSCENEIVHRLWIILNLICMRVWIDFIDAENKVIGQTCVWHEWIQKNTEIKCEMWAHIVLWSGTVNTIHVCSEAKIRKKQKFLSKATEIYCSKCTK